MYKSRLKFADVVRSTDGPDDPDIATCRGMCYPTQNDIGSRLYVVGWFDGDIQTLVHESCHLALMVLNHAGIDPRDSDGEAMCYLIDSMFAGLLRGKL